jgi:hypothetical protein
MVWHYIYITTRSRRYYSGHQPVQSDSPAFVTHEDKIDKSTAHNTNAALDAVAIGDGLPCCEQQAAISTLLHEDINNLQFQGSDGVISSDNGRDNEQEAVC